MKQKWIVWVLLAGICLAVGLALIDVRLSKSETNSNSEVASSRSEHPNGWLSFAPTSTALAVVGNGRLERSLAAEIARQAEGQPQVGRLELLVVPVDEVGQPLVYVTMRKKDLLWTPFYARSEIQIGVAYATSGNVSFRKETPTHFVQDASVPFVQYMGNYTFVDRSWGIISWPGYNRHLAEQIAQTVLASMKAELAR
jgi:hypothetical protein